MALALFGELAGGLAVAAGVGGVGLWEWLELGRKDVVGKGRVERGGKGGRTLSRHAERLSRSCLARARSRSYSCSASLLGPWLKAVWG